MLAVLQISLFAAFCALRSILIRSIQATIYHGATMSQPAPRAHETTRDLKQPRSKQPSVSRQEGKRIQGYSRIITKWQRNSWVSLVQSVITSIFATGVKEIADVSKLGTFNETSNRCMFSRRNNCMPTRACRVVHRGIYCTGIERKS
ncbi:1a52f989-6e5b-4ad8-a1ae-c74651c7213c-CDS [Sclerotinia trifoliorum]|uniref:1a52f989-6e5b-4ad8-a1ae-c74651c7213c-CDS n=1 Tax=Sclerotinia trifoliorum TaxID=28548 RepID=A0A8H2ZQ11_9HELO|nr:1a52f989-6e5b-4ad8-a1ae-c74651c7213c-CDS [Sclerotinia trifoliorum]